MRDTYGRFTAGAPPGPGRPRGRLAKFRKMIAELTGDGREIAEGLQTLWRDTNASPKERLAAFELALHYLLGKPETQVALSADITARPGPSLDGRALLARLPDELVQRVVEELDGESPPLMLEAPEDDD